MNTLDKFKTVYLNKIKHKTVSYTLQPDHTTQFCDDHSGGRPTGASSDQNLTDGDYSLLTKLHNITKSRPQNHTLYFYSSRSRE